MKILNLTLKKKWFDMIASGEKKEEYREIKKHWISRLIEKDYYKYSNIPHIKHLQSKYFDKTLFDAVVRQFDVAIFANGYKANRTVIQIPVESISIGYGKPEWGASPDTEYFVIKLGGKL